MRVICAIGQRGGPGLIKRLIEIVGKEAECLLLHVIDTGPRHDWKEFRAGRCIPGLIMTNYPTRRLLQPPKRRQAGSYRRGDGGGTADRPEGDGNRKRGPTRKSHCSSCPGDREAALIAIWAREGGAGHPRMGPAAVGHTARFVIDHAPCDVLLLREKDN